MKNIISKFALPVAILSSLYLLFSGSLFAVNLSLAVQVLAAAVMIWARHSFMPGAFNIHAEPKEGPLISSGPYKFIRHPMYSSVLVIIWTGILNHFSALNLGIAVFVTVVVYIRVITEEQYLRAHYPSYLDYSRDTKLIIPFII